MFKKVFVSVLVVAFLFTGVLSAFSEEVTPKTTGSSGKDDIKKSSDVKGLEMHPLITPLGNSKTLDNIHTALDINCAVGNVIMCIPSLGLDLIKGINWLFKERESTGKEFATKRAAIFSVVKDICLTALGDKNIVELPIKDTNTNQEGKIVCKTTENTRQTDYGDGIAIADLTIYYSENDTLKPLFRKTPIYPKREKIFAIIKGKCLQLLEKGDKGEEEFNDPDTSDKYKLTCWQELIGEEKFPLLGGDLIKNGKRWGGIRYPGIKRKVEASPEPKGKE
jgi:hypothetical protein